MAIARVLRPYGAFFAAAQRAHDLVIGWMSHSIPPGLGEPYLATLCLPCKISPSLEPSSAHLLDHGLDARDDQSG
jgi:hypothetical protein